MMLTWGKSFCLSFLLVALLISTTVNGENNDYSKQKYQDNEADTLASELLHVPGGLNALANKLSTRAEKEKEQADADAAVSAVIARASKSRNPRFKRYAEHVARQASAPGDDLQEGESRSYQTQAITRFAQQQAPALFARAGTDGRAGARGEDGGRRHPVAVAQAAIQAGDSAAAGYFSSALSAPAQGPSAQPLPASAAALAPTDAAAAGTAVAAAADPSQDPHLILRALQASMRQPAAAAAAADDGAGFDWGRLGPAVPDRDPAMRALERESAALDDVYDPSEDPENAGPGPPPGEKAAAGAYWNREDGRDAWWEHGGEDGMT